MTKPLAIVLLSVVSLASGCGAGIAVFNPAFVNTVAGGVVPVTPGPGAAFVLVRCLNETTQVIEFIVTVETEELVTDDEGNFQLDENDQFNTRPERQTVRLTATPNTNARDVGTLFACGESPVTVVGLGENLLPTDAAVFVGGQGTGGAAGFGVPAGNLNPLVLEVGNFNCGDTIIYQAFNSNSVAGGVALQSFLLPGSEQPSVFAGPDTFVTVQTLLDASAADENP